MNKLVSPQARLTEADSAGQGHHYPYNDVVGAILMGGLSTRMGFEKPHMRLFGENEPTILQRTHTLLASMLDTVWLSCRQGVAEDAYFSVYDIHPNFGPAGGVHAILTKAAKEGFSAAFVLSCDLPCMTSECLVRLLEARCEGVRSKHEEILVTTYCSSETNYLEPLVSIYEVRALPYLSSAIIDNNRKLQGIIPLERWHKVFFSPEDARAFFNLNTPQDIVNFNKLLKT